jgi:alcohol dehydrogenase YqhD (iron-dependent ADH family)
MEKDFATHKLEHELSAVYGVTHGAGLAALWASWARYVLPGHEARFAQYAVNVMHVTPDFGDLRETALEGIRRTEEFFRSIGMPVSISELLGRTVSDAEIDMLAERCSRGGTIKVGAFQLLDMADMKAIYEMAR